MEKLNTIDNDLRKLDSDTESMLSENDLLFGFLNPHTTSAGYHPTNVGAD